MLSVLAAVATSIGVNNLVDSKAFSGLAEIEKLQLSHVKLAAPLKPSYNELSAIMLMHRPREHEMYGVSNFQFAINNYITRTIYHYPQFDGDAKVTEKTATSLGRYFAKPDDSLEGTEDVVAQYNQLQSDTSPGRIALWSRIYVAYAVRKIDSYAQEIALTRTQARGISREAAGRDFDAELKGLYSILMTIESESTPKKVSELLAAMRTKHDETYDARIAQK